MSNSLQALELERAELLQKFLAVGDLRPGSITATIRRCGKPSCHCAKANDPGHDPQFRLTRKVNGKTVNESFPSPSALRKAQREVEEFQRFQQLSKQLIAVNEKICSLRHPEAVDPWTPQEKKRLLRSIKKSHAKSISG